MPTRCNRGFYCRSYCLLNMFLAPLCPSSGAQEYYTVVAACGISCCGYQVAGLVWSWGLCVRFAGCCSILQTGHITRQYKPLLHLVGILFRHINDDARSKSHQNKIISLKSGCLIYFTTYSHGVCYEMFSYSFLFPCLLCLIHSCPLLSFSVEICADVYAESRR